LSCLCVCEIGSLPLYRETWDFVAAQRREQYDDLRRAVQYLFAHQTPLKAQLTPEQMVQLSLVANGINRWFYKVCNLLAVASWRERPAKHKELGCLSNRSNFGEKTCLDSRLSPTCSWSIATMTWMRFGCSTRSSSRRTS